MDKRTEESKRIEELREEMENADKERMKRRSVVSTRIQRGSIVLLLVATFCLSILDGFNVYQMAALLLLMSFVIGVITIDGRKIRKLKKELEERQSKLDKWETAR